jgi:replicative DNA helicase
MHLLRSEDFYSNAHKIIFRAMVAIAEKKQRLDLVVLQDELLKGEKLNTIGGVAYLVSLQEDIPSVGLLEQHARIIREKAVLRELISSAVSIVTNCYSQDEKEIEVEAAEKVDLFLLANPKKVDYFTYA